ncbi:MAG: hypothetical protein ACK5MN_10485, partial [Lachnospiraceae bacterium]
MSINYNVTGSERKALVGAISEILVLEATYKGAPSFAYEIGNCTVDKNGVLSFADDVTDSAITLLVGALKERGYIGESDDAVSGIPDEPAAETPVADSVSADSGNSHELVIEIPREGFTDEAIENLKKIIASKKTLIEKALGVYDLPFNDDCITVKVTEDMLRFPWFILPGMDGEVDAYSRFICALCEMAKTQSRVTAKEQPVENEKFAMRIFLVRLGLKGPENKAVRRIMLANLTGNSSWKN